MNRVLPPINIPTDSLETAVIEVLTRIYQLGFNIHCDIRDFCQYLRDWSISRGNAPIFASVVLELHEYLTTTQDPDIKKVRNYIKTILHHIDMIEGYRVINILMNESSHRTYQLLGEGRVVFVTRFLGEFLQEDVDDDIMFILISCRVYQNYKVQKALILKNEFFILLSKLSRFTHLDLILLFNDENFELFVSCWCNLVDLSGDKYSKMIALLIQQNGGHDNMEIILEIIFGKTSRFQVISG